MGLDLDVSASITLGDLNQALDQYGEKHHRSDPKPFYMSRTASGNGAATNSPGSGNPGDGVPLILDCLAPPTGSIWQVRSITMFGNDAFTSVFNNLASPTPIFAALFVGDSLNLNLAGLKITGLAVPSTTYVPDTVMWCHPNENLIVQVGTPGFVLAAGQQVGVNINIEEWRERDVSRMNGA